MASGLFLVSGYTLSGITIQSWNPGQLHNIDGYTVLFNANANGYVNFRLENPYISQFAGILNTANCISISIYYRIVNLINDTEVMSGRFYKSDGVTAISNSIAIDTRTTSLAYTQKDINVQPSNILDFSKAAWTDAIFRVTLSHSASMGADNSQWEIDKLVVNMLFQSIPFISDTPVTYQTGLSSTPTFSFRGLDQENDNLEYRIQTANITTLIKHFKISLAKVGSPSDSLYVECRLGLNGNLIATSNSIPASSLSTSQSNVTFTFPDEICPDDMSFLLIRTGARDTSNYYNALTKTFSLYTDGEGFSASGTGGWTYSLSFDFVFEVLKSDLSVIISQTSNSSTVLPLYGGVKGTENDAVLLQTANMLTEAITPTTSTFTSDVDAGFSSGHPYASNTTQTYTFQTALISGGYYVFRISAKDPSGSNTYGGVKAITFRVLEAPTYNESVTLSSAHTVSIVPDFILNASVAITCDNTVVVTSIADLLAASTLSSVHQATAIGQLIIEVASQLNQNNALSVFSGLDYQVSVTISTDNAIVPLLELIMNPSSTLSLDTQIVNGSIADFFGNMSLTQNITTPVSGNLDINTVASLVSDLGFVTAGIFDFLNSIALNSDHQASTTGNVTLDGIIALLTENSISNQSFIDFIENVILSSDNAVSPSGNITVEALISLLSNNSVSPQGLVDFLNSIVLSSDHQTSLSLSIVFNESVSVVSINQLTALLEVTLDTAITLTNDNSITVLNAVDLSEGIQLNSANQINTVLAVIIETIATLNSDVLVNAINISDLTGVITLQTDNSVIAAGTIDLNQSISLVTNNSIVTTNIADLISLAVIASDHQVNLINQVIFEAITTFGADLGLVLSDNMNMLDSIVLTSDNAIATAGVVESALEVSIDVMANTSITPIANLNMNDSISFSTDISVSENGISDFLNTTVLLQDGNIQTTYGIFVETILNLISVSQMSPQEAMDFIANTDLAITNSALFDAFLEIYKNCHLSSSVGVSFYEEILGQANYVLNLGLNNTLITQCALLIDADNIFINASAFIEFIGEISHYDFSKNEIIHLKSIMTNDLTLRSLIVKTLILKSEVTSELNLISNIKRNGKNL